jgi:murein L,D-transpeptidase YafK
MWVIRVLVFVAMAFGLTACGSKFKTYNGPAVTEVQVHKAARKMYLIHENKVLKVYNVALGFAPVGHKQFEGDGKTPEGTYVISHRNPNSNYHLSLGVSYPNQADAAYAASMQKSPGGDIFIHGWSDRPIRQWDWTAGCIAVQDKEIEQVYAMVKDGTVIHILP